MTEKITLPELRELKGGEILELRCSMRGDLNRGDFSTRARVDGNTVPENGVRVDFLNDRGEPDGWGKINAKNISALRITTES